MFQPSCFCGKKERQKKFIIGYIVFLLLILFGCHLVLWANADKYCWQNFRNNILNVSCDSSMDFKEYYKLNEECQYVTLKMHRLNTILNSYPEDLDVQEYFFKLKNLHLNLTQTMEAQNELKKPCLTKFLNETYLPELKNLLCLAFVVLILIFTIGYYVEKSYIRFAATNVENPFQEFVIPVLICFIVTNFPLFFTTYKLFCGTFDDILLAC